MTAQPISLPAGSATALRPANDQQVPAGLRVATLDQIGAAVWDAFVLREPQASFFHLSGWQRVVSATYGYDTHYLAAIHGGRIVGVLPLVHLRSALFGRALISNAFCVRGGIAASEPAAVAMLAQAASTLGERLGVAYVEFRSEAAPIERWPVKDGTYASFRRPLSASEEANLKAIPRKKRADVRKSMKAGLRLDRSGDIDAFYRVYAESLRNLGTPVFAKRYLQAIQTTFTDRCEISLVHGPSGPVAGLMSFFFRDQVLPYFGGGTPAARPLHAYDHLYWTLMCRAAADGVRMFDFGRSKIGTGAFAYKTHWGFEPALLRYQYHLVQAKTVPDVNPLSPKYRLMSALWRKLPLPLANRFGPWLAKQLG